MLVSMFATTTSFVSHVKAAAVAKLAFPSNNVIHIAGVDVQKYM